jgi:hypothetical protein
MGPAISLVEEYVDAADMVSQEEYDASRIVSSYWSDGFSPFNYGTVVRFERLAISRETNSSAVWSLIAENTRVFPPRILAPFESIPPRIREPLDRSKFCCRTFEIR